MEVPAALPMASPDPVPEYAPSAALSLLNRPGQTGIRTRRVAILVANDVDGRQVRKLYADLLKDGAVPRLVGNMLGKVTAAGGDSLDVEISLEAAPSVMYDAVIVPDGDKASALLARNAHAIDFLREQYRHCKPILALGGGAVLLTKAMLPPTLPDGSNDPALLIDASLDAFKEALASHRSFARETDPPTV
jgi:catalase